jgi:hypothetical protein
MLFAEPLAFERGAIVLRPGTPALDRDALAAHTRECASFHRQSSGCPARS